MEFNCNLCNYSTNDKFNFSKHQKTKKHLEKTKKQTKPNMEELCRSRTEIIHICNFCNNIYANAGNLAKHRAICSEKKKLIDEYTNKQKENELLICELKEKLIQKDTLIATKDNLIATEIARRDDLVKSKDETILILTTETKNLKTILSSTGTLVEKSMSTLNFINTHYNEAPALEYVTDVPSLHLDLAEDKVASRIMTKYQNGTLVSFIGNLIIKNYKKKNPKDQSIWNSDNDRLTYMIRTIISEKNKHNQWEVDKKGVNTTAYVITPILDYIKRQLKNFIQTCDVGKRSDTTEKVLNITYKIETAYKIIVSIKNKVLSDDILKYIAPRLYIVKDVDLLC